MVSASFAADATDDSRPPARSSARARARMPNAHRCSGDPGEAPAGRGSRPMPNTARVIWSGARDDERKRQDGDEGEGEALAAEAGRGEAGIVACVGRLIAHRCPVMAAVGAPVNVLRAAHAERKGSSPPRRPGGARDGRRQGNRARDRAAALRPGGLGSWSRGATSGRSARSSARSCTRAARRATSPATCAILACARGGRSRRRGLGAPRRGGRKRRGHGDRSDGSGGRIRAGEGHPRHEPARAPT